MIPIYRCKRHFLKRERRKDRRKIVSGSRGARGLSILGIQRRIFLNIRRSSRFITSNVMRYETRDPNVVPMEMRGDLQYFNVILSKWSTLKEKHKKKKRILSKQLRNNNFYLAIISVTRLYCFHPFPVSWYISLLDCHECRNTENAAIEARAFPRKSRLFVVCVCRQDRAQLFRNADLDEVLRYTAWILRASENRCRWTKWMHACMRACVRFVCHEVYFVSH